MISNANSNSSSDFNLRIDALERSLQHYSLPPHDLQTVNEKIRSLIFQLRGCLEQAGAIAPIDVPLIGRIATLIKSAQENLRPELRPRLPDHRKIKESLIKGDVGQAIGYASGDFFALSGILAVARDRFSSVDIQLTSCAVEEARKALAEIVLKEEGFEADESMILPILDQAIDEKTNRQDELSLNSLSNALQLAGTDYYVLGRIKMAAQSMGLVEEVKVIQEFMDEVLFQPQPKMVRLHPVSLYLERSAMARKKGDPYLAGVESARADHAIDLDHTIPLLMRDTSTVKDLVSFEELKSLCNALDAASTMEGVNSSIVRISLAKCFETLSKMPLKNFAKACFYHLQNAYEVLKTRGKRVAFDSEMQRARLELLSIEYITPIDDMIAADEKIDEMPYLNLIQIRDSRAHDLYIMLLSGFIPREMSNEKLFSILELFVTHDLPTKFLEEWRKILSGKNAYADVAQEITFWIDTRGSDINALGNSIDTLDSLYKERPTHLAWRQSVMQHKRAALAEASGLVHARAGATIALMRAAQKMLNGDRSQVPQWAEPFQLGKAERAIALFAYKKAFKVFIQRAKWKCAGVIAGQYLGIESLSISDLAGGFTPFIYEKLGNMYRDFGNIEAAIEEYMRAIRICEEQMNQVDPLVGDGNGFLPILLGRYILQWRFDLFAALQIRCLLESYKLRARNGIEGSSLLEKAKKIYGRGNLNPFEEANEILVGIPPLSAFEDNLPLTTVTECVRRGDALRACGKEYKHAYELALSMLGKNDKHLGMAILHRLGRNAEAYALFDKIEDVEERMRRRRRAYEVRPAQYCPVFIQSDLLRWAKHRGNGYIEIANRLQGEEAMHVFLEGIDHLNEIERQALDIADRDEEAYVKHLEALEFEWRLPILDNQRSYMHFRVGSMFIDLGHKKDASVHLKKAHFYGARFQKCELNEKIVKHGHGQPLFHPVDLLVRRADAMDPISEGKEQMRTYDRALQWVSLSSSLYGAPTCNEVMIRLKRGQLWMQGKKYAEAEKDFRYARNHGDKSLKEVAKIELHEVLMVQGKGTEAKKLERRMSRQVSFAAGLATQTRERRATLSGPSLTRGYGTTSNLHALEAREGTKRGMLRSQTSARLLNSIDLDRPDDETSVPPPQSSSQSTPKKLRRETVGSIADLHSHTSLPIDEDDFGEKNKGIAWGGSDSEDGDAAPPIRREQKPAPLGGLHRTSSGTNLLQGIPRARAGSTGSVDNRFLLETSESSLPTALSDTASNASRDSSDFETDSPPRKSPAGLKRTDSGGMLFDQKGTNLRLRRNSNPELSRLVVEED